MKTLLTAVAVASLFMHVTAMAGTGHEHGDTHSHVPVASKKQTSVKQNAVDKPSASTTKKALQVDKKDIISITIPAKGEKEYKLQLAKGASFEHTWKTDKGELFFDFHGEPKGDTTGYFKTFEKGTKSSAGSSLTTEFAGTHGWYWRNSHAFPIVVTLNVSGEYKRLDREVDKKTAEKNAEKKIASLIEKNKLEKSWASIKASSVEKKDNNGTTEWVIIYNNAKVTEADKHKLYIFLTMGGEYIAANYTGN